MMTKLVKVLLCVVVWLGGAVPVEAHSLKTALLSFQEQNDGGRFLVRWVPSFAIQRSAAETTPVFPDHCARNGPWLTCGDRGLVGEVAFPNLPEHTEIVVEAKWRDGRTQMAALTGGEDGLDLRTLGGEASGRGWHLAAAYTRIGVEHIIGGIDHLLFVLGLVLLVGFNRKLIWTITAFTLAHSITLALSALGLVKLSQGPVEIVIALSIMLVAAEALHDRQTLSRRLPWLIAFGFGLIHGFGFAGALREIGLPEDQLGLALLCFNIGVELGQLAVIGVLLLLAKATATILPNLQRGHAVACYAMGIAAAYWTIERAVALFLPGAV